MRWYYPIAILAMIGLNKVKAQNGQLESPVSPSASAIAKVANYAVNMNTGLPDIAIPLGKIEAGGALTLPVALSYHGGGFKINERSGEYGLGWSISTDLQVTRSINGISDFGPGGYMTNTDILPYQYSDPSIGAFTYTRQKNFWLANQEKDGLPDKFNYKLINKSGSFFFQRNAGGYSIVPVPYDNIKIEYANNQFKITDVDGVVYYFGNQSVGWSADQIASLGYELANDDITAWKCVKIEDPTTYNKVEFFYTARPVETQVILDDKIEYYQNEQPCSMTGWTSESIYQWNSSYPNPLPNNYSNLLSAVNQKFYRLACPKYMEYVSGRADAFYMLVRDETTGEITRQKFVNDMAGGSISTVNGLRLTNITFRGGQLDFTGTPDVSHISFKNTEGITVRRASFTQTYIARAYNNVHRTYYLDEVVITGSDIQYKPEKYTMIYRNKSYFGSYLKGHDAWGYRNAHTVDAEYAREMGMPGLTPYAQVMQDYYSATSGGCLPPVTGVTFEVGNPDVDEIPDARYMAYGVLKRIIHPGGGYVDFDFEPNAGRYAAGGNFKPLLYIGGLRIQKITYYDGVSPITQPAQQKYYVYGALETGDGEAANRPILKFGYGKMYYDTHQYEQRIVYGIAPDNPFPAPGREFTYINIPCNSFSCLQLIAVEKKTTFLPNSALDLTYSNGSPVYYSKITEYQQDYGVHTGKTVTRFYPYAAFSGPGLPAIPPPAIIPGTDIRYIGVNWHVGAVESVSHFAYGNGKYSLQSKTEYQYTKYLLPQMPRAVYSFLKTIWQINSSMNNFYTDATFHPGLYSYYSDVNQDFVSGQYGIPVGKLLMTKETNVVRDKVSNELLVNTTDYYYDHLPYLQPSRIETKDSKQQTLTQHLSYAYDFTGDPVYAHMVSRNIIQPVIVAVNMKGTTTELSKTRTNYAFVNGLSFVSPASVEKSFQGSPYETEVAFTRYDQYGNLLEATGRDGITKSFLYGYHARYPVVMLQGGNYQSIPAGILSSPELVNPASDASLRTLLAPLYALGGNNRVVTYTYKPFIGMTSMTDINQRNTFYEYSPSGHLDAIKDHDNNVVKKYELTYASPSPESLTIFWTNKPVMGTYNNAYCSPYYSDPPAVPDGYMPRHYILPGGTQIWYAWTTPPPDPVVDNETNYGTSCILPSSEYAAVRLNTFLFVTIPDDVYVDFLQDDHIVATYKFMYTPANDQFRTIYLPEGYYKVSFRPSANYKGNLLKYHFYKAADQTHYWMDTGSTLHLENGANYELEVVNISEAIYPFLP